MIHSIEMTNFRGVAQGRLDQLAPLTVFTGPNACGKSTVLDALLIVCCSSPYEPVKPAVDRHPGAPGSARWLFRADQREGPSRRVVRHARPRVGLPPQAGRSGREPGLGDVAAIDD